MSDFDRRLSRLEGAAGPDARPFTFVFVDGDEAPAAAWARAHPGEAYPADAFVVRFVSPKPRGEHDRC